MLIWPIFGHFRLILGQFQAQNAHNSGVLDVDVVVGLRGGGGRGRDGYSLEIIFVHFPSLLRINPTVSFWQKLSFGKFPIDKSEGAESHILQPPPHDGLSSRGSGDAWREGRSASSSWIDKSYLRIGRG